MIYFKIIYFLDPGVKHQDDEDGKVSCRAEASKKHREIKHQGPGLGELDTIRLTFNCYSILHQVRTP